ncbi:MAG: RNA polymerase sigma factor [Acidobacteriota bacterium]|nr:RNA polymerase sigma factor [Acidobacteriota bacterium]
MNTPEGFEERYKKYFPSVLSFFLNRGFAREEAGELAQDVFLRAYEARDQFREEAAFRTWLQTIVVSTWKNKIRQLHTAKREGQTYSLDDQEQPPAAPAQNQLDQLIDKEHSSRLRQAVDRLPPRMRQCLVLRLGQGMKYKDIAETLNISVDTVKSQLSQGRQRLAEMLTAPDKEN